MYKDNTKFKIDRTGAIIGVVTGLTITFWIAMGANTIKIPWLPPAPTDHCNLTDLHNGTSHIWQNQTDMDDFIIWTDTPYNGTGLSKMYSLSYHANALTGISITMVVGLIASFITGANKPEEVNPKYISHVVRRLYYGTVEIKPDNDNDIDEMEVLAPTEKWTE